MGSKALLFEFGCLAALTVVATATCGDAEAQTGRTDTEILDTWTDHESWSEPGGREIEVREDSDGEGVWVTVSDTTDCTTVTKHFREVRETTVRGLRKNVDTFVESKVLDVERVEACERSFDEGIPVRIETWDGDIETVTTKVEGRAFVPHTRLPLHVPSPGYSWARVSVEGAETVEFTPGVEVFASAVLEWDAVEHYKRFHARYPDSEAWERMEPRYRAALEAEKQRAAELAALPIAENYFVATVGTSWVIQVAAGTDNRLGTREVKVHAHHDNGTVIVSMDLFLPDIPEGLSHPRILFISDGAWMERDSYLEAPWVVLPAKLEVGTQWKTRSWNAVTGGPRIDYREIVSVDTTVVLPNGKTFENCAAVETWDAAVGRPAAHLVEYYALQTGYVGSKVFSEINEEELWFEWLIDFERGPVD